MSLKTYRIGEAAELLNLKSYVLRFWETEFTQLEPLRTDKGQRLYTEDNIRLLMRIKYLLHERGLTIEGAKRMLSEQQAGLTGVDLLAESKAAGDAMPNFLPNSQNMVSGQISPTDPVRQTDRTGGFGPETEKKPEALNLAQMRLKAHTDKTLNFLDSLRPDFGMNPGAPQNAPVPTPVPTSLSSPLTAGSAQSNPAPQANSGQADQPTAQSATTAPDKFIYSVAAAASGGTVLTDAGQASPSFQNATGTGTKAGAGFIQELLDELEELRRMLKA